MQDAQSAPSQAAMRENLFLRNDTIFGICEALGEDFGFNPNWLRIALCASLYFSPAGVIGGYLGLGIVIAASRFMFPTRIARQPEPEIEVQEEREEAQAELPLAA